MLYVLNGTGLVSGDFYILLKQFCSFQAGPSSVKSSSGSSSKKSKNRNSDAFSTNQSSTNVLLKRFRCLTYFDQHFVTAQASKAVLSSFTEYIEEK